MARISFKAQIGDFIEYWKLKFDLIAQRFSLGKLFYTLLVRTATFYCRGPALNRSQLNLIRTRSRSVILKHDFQFINNPTFNLKSYEFNIKLPWPSVINRNFFTKTMNFLLTERTILVNPAARSRTEPQPAEPYTNIIQFGHFSSLMKQQHLSIS